MISDQIGDLLTRIRNATMVRHPTCHTSYSKLKVAILKLLKKEGYILDFQRKFHSDKIKSDLEIILKYQERISVVQGIKRVSKPGLRIYVNSKKIPTILEGIGIAVLSTSQGLMTNEVAKQKKLGGEILFCIW